METRNVNLVRKPGTDAEKLLALKKAKATLGSLSNEKGSGSARSCTMSHIEEAIKRLEKGE